MMPASSWLIPVVLAAWSGVDQRLQAQAKPDGVLSMDDTFTTFFHNVPFEAPVGRRPIQMARISPAAALRASLSDDVQTIRWGVNDELNGRIGTVIALSATGEPAERLFKTALPDGLVPQMLLGEKDRIAASGRGKWALFDPAGQLVALGATSMANILLDPSSDHLIAGDQQNELEFHSIASGAASLTVSPLVLMDFSRTFIGLRGPKVAVVSQQMDTDVHAEAVECSMIEIIDLAYEDGPTPMVDLVRKTNVLQAAMHGNTIVLATFNRIYFLDFDLKFLDAWSGDFQPLGFSLDELSNVYMLVRTQGKVMLWKLIAGAQRAWEIAPPAESIMILQPPIVGFDHTVYLVTSEQILAISESGKVLWIRKGAGRISGAVVTANDKLVITEGSHIAAINLLGERQVIHDCGEELLTPPVIAADGSIYAASRTNLFRVRYRLHQAK